MRHPGFLSVGMESIHILINMELTEITQHFRTIKSVRHFLSRVLLHFHWLFRMCPKTVGIMDISTKMVGFLHDHLTLTFLEQLFWNTKCIFVIKVHIYLLHT